MVATPHELSLTPTPTRCHAERSEASAVLQCMRPEVIMGAGNAMPDEARKSRVARALIYPFLVLAIIGSIVTLIVHAASLFGVLYPLEHFLKLLASGVVILFLPTIFAINWLARDFKQKEIWRAVLLGCPEWMQRTLWIIFGYAWVGYFVLPFLYGGGMDSPGNKARFMSAILLIFYLIPAAVLSSATWVKRFD